MNKQHENGTFDTITWDNLAATFSLTSDQLAQLKRYAQLLVEWNQKYNLTAILDAQKMISHHFYDSLAIVKHIDFTTLSAIADIGTGAGFPGMPLKVVFPHLHVVLIEVNAKKRDFLAHLVNEFNLTNVTICGDDWRTFLRKSTYTIDYFFARASLQPEELVRIFKPSSHYKDAQLVYWASKQWVPSKQVEPFVKREIGYTLDNVARKYVFLSDRLNS